MSNEILPTLPSIFVEKEPGFYFVDFGTGCRAEKIKDFVPRYTPLPRKYCEWVVEQIKRQTSPDYIRIIITQGQQFFGYLKKYKPEIYQNHYVISKKLSLEVFEHALYTWKFALSTVQLQDVTINRYYKWLKYQVADDTFYYRVGQYNVSRSLQHALDEASELFAIPIHEIVGLRNIKGVRLIDALVFEFLLSTGLRKGEAQQLQARDIIFNENCHDIETDLPSIYFRGSVSLLRPSLRLKNQFSRRKVYMSMLARELMIKWFRFNNIKPGSSQQVFAGAESPLGNMKKLHPTFYIDMLRKYKPHLHAVQESEGRLEGMQKFMSETTKSDALEHDDQNTDIDEDEMFRRKFIYGQMRQAIAKQKVEEDVKLKDIVISREYSGLWPHYMRHLAGMIMYYRCQSGARLNVEETRRFMGHGPKSNMLLTEYTHDYNYIQNDAEWKRVFAYTKLGWLDCRLKLPDTES